MQALDYTVYLVTSEAALVKSPMSLISLMASAGTVTDDGSRIVDQFVIYGLTPEDLPSLDDIKKQIVEFAKNLDRLRTAPGFEDYYRGPVMFEDAAVMQIFSTALISPQGVLALRPKEGARAEETLDERVGQSIMDHRITVKNYSSKSEYNGTKLYGSYQIDAEGVAAPDEITLIEKGKLEGLLNGRIPTYGAPRSTGSSRWKLTNQNPSFGTSPGTLHIQAEGAVKPDAVKKQLLKLAKDNNQDYAYIVRNLGQVPLIYRIDVKTGEETLVRGGMAEKITLKKLRKLDAVSSQEAVQNIGTQIQTITSIIYPTSFIIDDIEITKATPPQNNNVPLTFPLRRK